MKTGHNSIHPQLKPTKSEVHCLVDFFFKKKDQIINVRGHQEKPE